jgi:peptidoglycan/LPS O-acetylase OafA/YrhL
MHMSRASHKDAGSFRADIEGLRAVAVVLVILNHLVGWPGGGFVGVDVFFVISGFLITGLLINETDHQGRISFRRFYARRARRILPAALTVLLAVTVAAQFAYPGTTRVKETQTDVLWALGFGANIHFSQIGTDYFAAGRAPSLVQHFWSLAVEEQFYLLWPIVVLAVLTLLGRSLNLSQRTARQVLLGVVGAVAVASFAWGLQQSATTPATAYFSAPARAWELGVGAFVAVAATCFPGLFARLGRAAGPLSLLGLGGIVAGAVLVQSSPGFPVPGAALPVLATALVIIAGIGGPTGHWSAALTNPVSRYLGRISYSLYLVHWPVVVLVGSLLPSQSWLRYPICVLAMLGASVASYHFVEAPFRKVSLRRPSLRMPSPARRQTLSKQVLASLSLVTVAVALSLFVPASPPPSFALPRISTAANASEPAPDSVDHSSVARSFPAPTAVAQRSVAQPSARLANGINDALAGTRFPSFNPPLTQLTIKSAQKQWGDCRGAVDPAKCSFGDGSGPGGRVAVVIGDSFAMAWMPTIEAALPAKDWKIYGLQLAQCPAAYVSVRNGQSPPAPHKACDTRHRFVTDLAKSLDPDLVILSSTPHTVTKLSSNAQGAAALREYQAGLTKTITLLRPGNERRILTLTGPPTSTSLQSCVTTGSVPARCVTALTPFWRSVAAAERRAAVATDTSYSDVHLWFCNANNYCPGYVGRTPIRWDTGHLTPAYAKLLGPELAGVIDKVMK